MLCQLIYHSHSGLLLIACGFVWLLEDIKIFDLESFYTTCTCTWRILILLWKPFVVYTVYRVWLLIQVIIPYQSGHTVIKILSTWQCPDYWSFSHNDYSIMTTPPSLMIPYYPDYWSFSHNDYSIMTTPPSLMIPYYPDYWSFSHNDYPSFINDTLLSRLLPLLLESTCIFPRYMYFSQIVKLLRTNPLFSFQTHNYKTSDFFSSYCFESEIHYYQYVTQYHTNRLL